MDKRLSSVIWYFKVSTSELRLLSLQESFRLYTHEKQGMGLQVLTRTLRNITQTIDTFSKKLDYMTVGWLPYFGAMSSTCGILQEAQKFTLKQPTMIFVPFKFLTLLKQKGGYWLMAGCIKKWDHIFRQAKCYLINLHYLKSDYPTPKFIGKLRPPK